MTIHIWSDVVCPFCYIGKRHLEKAIELFNPKEEIQLTWHSFQLDPDLQPKPGSKYIASLAARKGWSEEQTLEITRNVTEMAAAAGLTYRFDQIIEANTFLAHQLIHLAGEFQAQGLVKERLLSAHFCEGRDVGALETLIDIGQKSGIPGTRVADALSSGEYAGAVHNDIRMAQQIGIRGVPFFLFNNSIGISGAQPVSAFIEAIRKASGEK